MIMCFSPFEPLHTHKTKVNHNGIHHNHTIAKKKNTLITIMVVKHISQHKTINSSTPPQPLTTILVVIGKNAFTHVGV